MSDFPSIPTSVRFADDVQVALAQCARDQKISVSDIIQHAVYSYLVEQASTNAETSRRMTAENSLLGRVIEQAKLISQTEWTKDVTLELFEWIDTNHRAEYDQAIGPNGEQVYRINPLLAKRYAYALGADYERDSKDKPAKEYLPRNANKLIQSYTLLRKL